MGVLKKGHQEHIDSLVEDRDRELYIKSFDLTEEEEELLRGALVRAMEWGESVKTIKEKKLLIKALHEAEMWGKKEQP